MKLSNLSFVYNLSLNLYSLRKDLQNIKEKDDFEIRISGKVQDLEFKKEIKNVILNELNDRIKHIISELAIFGVTIE